MPANFRPGVLSSAASLAAHLALSLAGNGEAMITGVAIDSRAVRPGDLFVALAGERADGHDFVCEAARRGAAAALVARRSAEELPQLIAPDPLAALQRLAVLVRAESSYRLAAITGSLGKTTTKEFLAALLATTFRVGATRGSRNSQAAFPAELCNQPAGLDWMVAELGMNHAGELDRLGAIARPDMLAYTTIAPVHLEFFAGIEGIAAAKAELIPHLAPAGLLVLNLADARVAAFAGRFAGECAGYGLPGASDLWIEAYAGRGLLGAAFVLRGAGLAIPIDWEIAGRHQADNLLAASLCALRAGVPPAAIGAAAASLRPALHRGEILRLPGAATLIDDSYNSSPKAALALLDLLGQTPGRRIAVLGEMLELGEQSLSLHREVGRRAAEVAEIVIAVGAEAARALAAAAGGARVFHTEDAAAALLLLRPLLQLGDVALVKGSRGIGLDRLVSGLLEESGELEAGSRQQATSDDCPARPAADRQRSCETA
ncbi:MAG: UDP-N-acetylmuramoyl-tripeptide--D-alanyl-D-alanine ligase [Acidobacteriota bacterium]